MGSERHKQTIWAREILAQQQSDGMWGTFHSLALPNRHNYTTEQALRRLEALGFTIEDDCIKKAVDVLIDCLTGKRPLPGRREKSHDWDAFTDLMLATWIRRFTDQSEAANRVAGQWAFVISSAFRDGAYDHAAYLSAYREAFGRPVKGGRLNDFVTFYQVSLVSGQLDAATEGRVLEHILHNENGIYYFNWPHPATKLPEAFASLQAARYLSMLELLSKYPQSRRQLQFAASWLCRHQSDDGTWDMGPSAMDHIAFPLSDSWRDKRCRIADCTYRINRLVEAITGSPAS
jgi:hypothetical protein